MLKRIISLCFFAILAACGSDQRNGNYTIAFDPDWFGISLMGQQKSVTGFSQDLLKEISKIEKMKLSLLSGNWDTLVPNLKTEQYDAILSSIYPYLFNQTYFEFSDAFLLTGPVLVLPANSNVSSIAGLDGKEIATLPDTDGALYLEKNPQILIRAYDSIPDALNAIVEGTIDGAVVDVLIASAYCRNIYAGQLKIATAPLNDAGIRLLTRADSPPAIIKTFNHGLAELKKNGTYQMLLKKWSLDD